MGRAHGRGRARQEARGAARKAVGAAPMIPGSAAGPGAFGRQGAPEEFADTLREVLGTAADR